MVAINGLKNINAIMIMKSTFKFFVSAVAVMATLAGCAKKEISNQTPATKTVQVVAKHGETKTTLEGNRYVRWMETDNVKAYGYLDNYVSTKTEVSDGGATATFTFETDGDEIVYMIYPASAAGEESSDVIEVTIPTEQTAVANGFADGANVAIGAYDNGTAYFYSIGALVSFDIKNDDITSIKLECPGATLTGKGEAALEGTEIIAEGASAAEGTADYVVIKAAEGQTLTNGAKYFAVVYAGDLEGMKLTFTRKDGKTATYTNPNKLELECNSNLTIFDAQIPDSKWVDGDIKPVEHTISWTGPSDWVEDDENDKFSLKAQPYGYSVVLKKNNGGTSPTVNATAKDCRLYAKGTATISNSKEITKIIFNISTAGKKRLATITASVGTIATQTAEADMVVWTGKAKEVTFTVGEKADYGSEGSSKAGQLCFDTIDATYLSDGSEPEPEPTKYTITIAEGIVGGTVTASVAEAVENAEVTLTATPAAGYDFSSWNVTNAATSAEITVTDNKFTMPAANVNVSANFRKQTTGETWTATAFASIAEEDELVIVGKSGDKYYAMSNDKGTEDAPTAVSVTISGDDLAETPESNIIWVAGKDSDGNIIFYLSDAKDKWLYCTATNNGVRVGTNTNKTFALDNSGYLKHNGTSRFVGIYNSADWRCYTAASGNIANQTFKFYVKKGGATKYSVTCATVTGGTLSATPTKAPEGTIVELTATPAAEYTFNNDWTVKGADETPITVTDGRFTMPAQNVTVSGSFTQKTYAITKTPATNGTYTVKVSDVEVETAVKGAKVTLAAEPAELYKFDGFTVKETVSGNVVTVSNNTFTMPAAAVTVSAAFSEKPVGPTYEGSGTEEDPYTINDAYMLIDGLGTETSDEVCVKGTIYQVDSYSSQYKSITYWIGSSEKPLEVFGGKNLNNTDFASKEDLNIGDEVIVKGYLKKYNDTYEFTSNNYLVSIKKAPYLKVTPSKTNLSAAGETITVNVDTNVEEWTASSENLVFQIVNKGQQSFQIEVGKNGTTLERSSQITVSATGVEPVRFTVKQSKSGSKEKDDTAKYTLTPAAGTNNSYAGNCDVKVGGITWNVTGNAQQVPWRLGGKSISNVDRTVYSKTAYSKELWKVSLTVGAASSITVNSLKLVYSTNADFSNSKEISGAFSENSTINFEAEFSAGCYYKFVFNVSVSDTKSNRFVEFKEVKFFGYQGE